MAVVKKKTMVSPANERRRAAGAIRRYGLPSDLVVSDVSEEAIRALVAERLAVAAVAGPKGWLSRRAGSGRDVAYRFVEGRTTTSAENLLQILAAVGVRLVIDPKWDPAAVPVIR